MSVASKLKQQFSARRVSRSGADLSVVHPLSLLLGNHSQNPVIVDVPFSRVRSWGGRVLEQGSHPLIDVIHDYVVNGTDHYDDSALKQFVSKQNVVDAADTLGLDRNMAQGFAGLSPLMSLFPWEAGSPLDREAIYVDTLKQELNLDFIIGTDLQIDRDRRGAAELARILAIAESILAHGYDESTAGFTPLQGELLISENLEWNVLIRHGEHRAAALQYFGFEKVSIVIASSRIVRASEYHFWPQVVDENLTSEGALNVFERIMAGRENIPLVNVVGFP